MWENWDKNLCHFYSLSVCNDMRVCRIQRCKNYLQTIVHEQGMYSLENKRSAVSLTCWWSQIRQDKRKSVITHILLIRWSDAVQNEGQSIIHILFVIEWEVVNMWSRKKYSVIHCLSTRCGETAWQVSRRLIPLTNCWPNVINCQID